VEGGELFNDPFYALSVLSVFFVAMIRGFATEITEDTEKRRKGKTPAEFSYEDRRFSWVSPTTQKTAQLPGFSPDEG
jgi:hypothetical protein